MKNIILLFLGISALSSCQKADNNNPVQVDVYIAGYGYANDSPQSNVIARYWKNGMPVDLTNGSETAMAKSIFVSGDDVYASGVVMGALITSNPIATYWKNGVPKYLTDGSKQADAKSIVVSGNEIYVAGSEWSSSQNFTDIAKYWKNGTAVEITDGTLASCANSIAVFEDKIYIAGSQFLHLNNKAKFWKYNISQNPIDEALSDGEAFSIFLSIK